MPRQEKIAQPTTPEEQESIPVTALVSEDLFQAVADRLAEHRRRQREYQRGGSYLLSGLLICQGCGSAYCARRHRSRGGQPYIYYHCLGTDKHRHGGEAICDNRSVGGELLEAAVWADACSLLRDPARLRCELKRRLAHSEATETHPAQQRDILAKLQRRMTRLVDAYEHEILDKPEFEVRMRRLREQLACERETQRQLQAAVENEEQLRLLEGNFETFAQHIAAGLEQADFPTRRKLLQLLVQRIEIDQAEVRVFYRIPHHPFALRPARGGLQHCLTLLARGSAPDSAT